MSKVNVPGSVWPRDFSQARARVLRHAGFLVLIVVSALALSSCASVPQTITKTPPPIEIKLSSLTVTLNVSQSQPFSVTVQNDPQNLGVSWSLSGTGCTGSACGTLTNVTASSVTYTAPNAAPNPPSVTLKATSNADASAFASATITITAPPISVTVDPPSQSVQTSTSANFSAVLQSDSQNKGVSWSVSGAGCTGSACGTLTNVTITSVTYNAPPNAPNPPSVSLIATSVADPAKTGSAALTITNAGGTSTPTLVWSKSGANTTGDNTNSYTTNLPTSGTLPGNALVASFQYGSGPSATVTDDKGDTFTLLASNSDGNQTLSTYCVLPTTGARVLTITFSGGAPQWVSLVNASEWLNLSCALDGSAAANDSATLSASLAAGNIATTSDGDLLYQTAIEDGSTGSETWTAGASPWTLLSASTGQAGANTPQVAQFQVQATHGSLNPTLSMSSQDSWVSVAVALKAASTGTAPPAGIRIVHMQEESLPPGSASHFSMQFPSSGNLLITASVDSPDYDIVSISDNHGNSHAQIGAPFNDGSTSGDSQTFYVANAVTSSTLALTYTMTGSPVGGSDFFLFDVTGASSSPYDTAAGRQTATAPLGLGTLPGPTITPSTANGLVIVQVGVTSFTIDAISPGFFVGTIPNPVGQTNPTNQNNGWAFDFNATATTRQYTWTAFPAGSQVEGWASTAVAFKAP